MTRRSTQSYPAGDVPALAISTETICFIIIKARQFDVKDVATIPDPESNASDDHMISILEDRGNDPVVQEIGSMIRTLSEDEQIELVALSWLGRGDYTLDEWPALREEAARARRSYGENTTRYLLDMPLISDYLEEALSQFGRSCDDIEMDHL